MINFLLISLIICKVSSLNTVLSGQSILYGLSSLAENSTNSTQCEQDLNLLFESVGAGHVWSLKALDASGEPSTGFIYGNNLWLGFHSQCMDISNRYPFEVNYKAIKQATPTAYDFPPYEMGFYIFILEHNNTLQMHSQYLLEFTIQLGLCLPKSCTPNSLEKLFTSYLDAKFLNIQNLYDLNLQLIEIKPLREDVIWLLKEPQTIILLIIVTCISLLTIIGTIYDVNQHKEMKNVKKEQVNKEVIILDKVQEKKTDNEEHEYWRMIRYFSFSSNIKSLMDPKLSKNPISMIYGLRFFLLVWMVSLHTFFFTFDFVNNPAILLRDTEKFYGEIISNGVYVVDSYLFLSGFLLAYHFFKSPMNREKCYWKDYTKKFKQFLTMNVNRYIRLTPLYLIVILITTVIHIFYRDNSVFITIEKSDISCSKYWWRNLFYINHMYKKEEMCIWLSWYLGVDMQCFIIMSFLLILSTLAFRVASVSTLFLLFASIIGTIYTSYTIELLPTIDDYLIKMELYYFQTWLRIGPYIIGVITAYILVVKLNNQLNLKKKTITILSLIILLFNSYILFARHKKNLSVEYFAFYLGISRSLWAIGTAWIVVICCTGNAVTLNKFLSLKGFVPLSKMTYAAYLIHPVIIRIVFLSSETGLTFSQSVMSLFGGGLLFYSFLCSFLLTTLFEIPFLRFKINL